MPVSGSAHVNMPATIERAPKVMKVTTSGAAGSSFFPCNYVDNRVVIELSHVTMLGPDGT